MLGSFGKGSIEFGVYTSDAPIRRHGTTGALGFGFAACTIESGDTALVLTTASTGEKPAVGLSAQGWHLNNGNKFVGRAGSGCVCKGTIARGAEEGSGCACDGSIARGAEEVEDRLARIRGDLERSRGTICLFRFRRDLATLL